MAGDLSTAAEGAGQIADGLGGVHHSAQSTLEGARSTQDSAGQLSAIAAELDQAMAGFRV